jgi:hemolysin activation/secretion protein
MASVRGYKESEAIGDNALHASGELISPDIVKLMDLGLPLQMNVYGFYDIAALKVIDPDPEQNEHIKLQGFGFGIRGMFKKYVEYDVSWGIAINGTDRVDNGNDEVNFRVKFMF